MPKGEGIEVEAGLYVRSLQNLENQDLGFDRRNLLVFSLDARRSGATPDRVCATYCRVLEKIEGLPGVRSATASQLALLTGWINNFGITTDGPGLQPGQSGNVYWNGVGPAFFETMGIPLVLGRGIDWADIRGARRVAVVNEALARYFFPGENSVGHHVSSGPKAVDGYEIVGVARNARYDNLRGEMPRTLYVPYTSRPGGSLYFEVRTSGEPAALVPDIQSAVREADPDLPLRDVKTQSEQLVESLRQDRMFARLSTFFGMLALLLVAVGLYGTLAYGVTRRTNEIGIRTALGAKRLQVIWMVLRQSLVLVGAGLAVGLPASLAATRYISSQLYDVAPNDAPTIIGAVTILVGTGLAASYLPARRAARLSPTAALRYE